MSNSFVDWVIKFREDIIQFFKFQLASIIAYLADYGVYVLIYTFALYANPVGYLYAKMMSYPVGLMTSYLINKRWTFGVKRNIFSKYLLKFIFVNACALSANLAAIYILTNYYSISPYWSAIMATVFSFCINFTGNKIWVFE